MTEGNLFVALSGGNTDGHRYIPDALSRGAAAIVGEQDIVGLHQPYIRVSDSRLALAHLSAAFYGFHARRLTVIGVTGTDGKTTTSFTSQEMTAAYRAFRAMVTLAAG